MSPTPLAMNLPSRSYLQVLVDLNITIPQRLDADSGWHFVRAMCEEALRVAPQFRFSILTPRSLPDAPSNCRVLEVPLAAGKYAQRFGFEWDAYSEALKQMREPVDLVWSNQIERLSGVRALASYAGRREVPAVAYFHYPVATESSDGSATHDPSLSDYGLGEAVTFRQYEGARTAVMTLYGSEFARDLQRRLFALHGLDVSCLRDGVLYSPSDSSISRMPRGNPSVIMHNHRLYAHYGVDELLDWLSYARSQSGMPPFTVHFTDPLGPRSREQNRHDPSVERIRRTIKGLPWCRLTIGADRNQYLQLIEAAGVGLAPFRRSPAWSLSILDMMRAGRPVVARPSGAFPEILGDRKLLLPTTKQEFSDSLRTLLSDRVAWLEEGDYCSRRALRFGRAASAEILFRIFRDIAWPTQPAQNAEDDRR